LSWWPVISENRAPSSPRSSSSAYSARTGSRVDSLLEHVGHAARLGALGLPEQFVDAPVLQLDQTAGRPHLSAAAASAAPP
jgi:hypothetical protein